MGKACRVKQSTKSSKRRKFHGNRHTRSETVLPPLVSEIENNEILQIDTDNATVDESGESSSVSYRKIQDLISSTPKESDNKICGYRIIDVDILSDIINNVCCQNCKMPGLRLLERFSKKKGLSSFLYILCPLCKNTTEFYTSKQCGSTQSFDVNRRIVYTMGACGQGYAGIEKFTTFMNMPKPMTQNNYDKIARIVSNSAKVVAQDSMADAAQEINSGKSGCIDTGVSVEGSWQRRGYSSLNGVVTAISMDTGKILDCEPMSRSCKACNLKEKLKKMDPLAFDVWKASHDCTLNYCGSAPGMEVTGAKRIFSRSIEKSNLRYVNFYGDGDGKSFASIKDIYEGITVRKLECVGHVQKRVGTRLRNLKKKVKGLGGKGKLTNSIIDRLQNYYGIAVRSNSNDLNGMTKAICATLFHVASSSKNNWHDHCPDGSNSWCRYKQDKANSTSTYKPGPGLPQEVIGEVKPIYIQQFYLSSPELLEKCLHCKTQNQNECFNICDT